MMRRRFLLAATLWASQLVVFADDTGSIMTVAGPIDADDLGKTLAHEHVLVDFIGASETGYHRWNREEVIEVALPRLERIRDMGYKAVFECTPAFLGRDPALLAKLSELSGLHLITNTGYYGARENRFIPGEIMSESADELAKRWIREFYFGIERTGIRPGFIKIGVDRGESLSPFHRTLVRAAARTSLATGLAIACHTGPSEVVFEIASLLEEEGAPLESFIWTHATRDSPENQIKAAKMGMWISIDNLRENAQLLNANVERLVRLKEAGLLHQALVSQDAGWYRPGEPQGGAFAPYEYVETRLLPALEKQGLDAADIELLLHGNPKRAFRLRSPKNGSF